MCHQHRLSDCVFSFSESNGRRKEKKKGRVLLVNVDTPSVIEGVVKRCSPKVIKDDWIMGLTSNRSDQHKTKTMTCLLATVVNVLAQPHLISLHVNLSHSLKHTQNL